MFMKYGLYMKTHDLSKTFSIKAHEITHDWHVIDASNLVLGKLAAFIAHYLRGKHKPEYTPHLDVGDYIVVTNIEKIRVTGNKFKDKTYYRHTGYPGGIKSETFDKLQARNPMRVLELAVKGMLPKNSLGRKMFKKLKLYVGNAHPHIAQQVKLLKIED